MTGPGELDLPGIKVNWMELTIPRTSGDPLTISVEVGAQLYVVGANGTGKSALFQYWVTP